MATDKPVPAAFLPPPRRERKHFADAALFEAPAQGQLKAERIAALQSALLQEKPYLTKPLAELHEERRLARAVAALLVGVPR